MNTLINNFIYAFLIKGEKKGGVEGQYDAYFSKCAQANLS